MAASSAAMTAAVVVASSPLGRSSAKSSSPPCLGAPAGAVLRQRAAPLGGRALAGAVAVAATARHAEVE
eukprot:1030889-Pleurochrysis_carterae.AAC.1